MTQYAIQIVATALLASGLTLGIGWWLWERRLRRRVEAELERRLAEAGEELERRLAAVGEELAGRIREQVRRGVVDGVSSISTVDVLRGTQQGLTEAAAGLVRGGLSSILGPGERRRKGATPRGGGSGASPGDRDEPPDRD